MVAGSQASTRYPKAPIPVGTAFLLPNPGSPTLKLEFQGLVRGLEIRKTISIAGLQQVVSALGLYEAVEQLQGAQSSRNSYPDIPRRHMGVSENRGTLFGAPYNKDPTIDGTILGSPIFGNPHIVLKPFSLQAYGARNIRQHPKP